MFYASSELFSLCLREMGLNNRMKKRVGFVILVWNSEKVIDKCLLSICNLKQVEPYIVLIDNGSTDNSISIVNQYVDRLNLELIRYDNNMGTTVSRNSGLRKLQQVSPDYYCILDSDTEVNDDAFVKLIMEMEKNPSYGVIGPTLVSSSGLVQMSARCFPTALEKFYKAVPIKRIQAKGEKMEIQSPTSPDAVSYPVDYLMSAFWLIRPDTLSKAGMLDEKIFYAPEDAEYCINVWKNGYQVAFCPSAVIIHEWQRLSKKKLFSKMNWEHIKGLCYMFKKHHYFFSAKKLRASFGR